MPEPCQIRLGTSAFTAAGWPWTFYPQGMKAADYLSYYATRFDTVEVDSTFYGAPKAQAVSNWALRTPRRERNSDAAERAVADTA